MNTYQDLFFFNLNESALLYHHEHLHFTKNFHTMDCNWQQWYLGGDLYVRFTTHLYTVSMAHFEQYRLRIRFFAIDICIR